MSVSIEQASTAAFIRRQTPVTPCGLGNQDNITTTKVLERAQSEPEIISTSEQEREQHTAMEDKELTEEEVFKHLSSLGRSATGLHHVYKFLSIPRQKLTNVSILCNYIHLQKLELPYNRIKDLSCVSHMPYLITLDASHNELIDFFGFQPPKNLKEVNLSHNHISSMKDLSAYTSLCKLILDYNSVSVIQGLEKCSSLTHLSIAHNKVLRISGVNNLRLKQLCLQGNLIKTIENLQTLRALQILDLSSNRIQSLSGLQNLHLLGTVNLESNMIAEIKEAAHVRDLLLLRELNLKRNPIQEQPDYKLSVIFLLHQLTILDEQDVTAEEKVSAVNKYDPPLEIVAARDHMTHMVYQHMQPQVIFDRRPYFGEEDGTDYHFVQEEEFHNMICKGQFVQTMQYGDHWYGLSREAIERVAREGLACCVHMELEGVLSLKNSYFEPRYILLIPTSTENFISVMNARGFYTNSQIEKAVSRISIYVRFHRERPGFFDSIVPCDNRGEAYNALKQLIKEYLGLEGQGAEAQDSSSVIEQNSSTGKNSDERGSVENVETSNTGSYNRNYYNKVQGSLTFQKTSAELASIYRRQQMVQEALMGKSPGAYTQLFKRFVHAAPSLLTPHAQPSATALVDRTEDSSSEESSASSGLSMHGSAGALSMGSSAEGLDAGSGPKVSPLGQNLELLIDPMESGVSPESSHSAPEQVSPTVASSPGRPGSDAHPVLPPIPQGRKATEAGSESQLTEQSEQVVEG
ncbi:leucine-rich repeat and guanylate kinase domain-containing protein isoform X5 [Trichomycterus rosablanca]|uniref:leucine-rich repeat and guanylate kinase domain-containing protein isoform X5 n=1 Tax=Trichomycterus rosablanca TaxID=2290929 RepID=UPI002F355A9A